MSSRSRQVNRENLFGPTAEEQLTALIAALPDPADIDPEDEEQVERISGPKSPRSTPMPRNTALMRKTMKPSMP